MLKTISDNPNYLARVVQMPELNKHPNADKLALANISGSIVITGINANAGELYIYFPLESAINKDFLSFVNGFQEPDLNKDKNKKSFFGKHGRVRALSLRGVVSEGYLHPVKEVNAWIKSLNIKYVISEKDLNTDFDYIGDNIKFVEKYINSVELRKIENANRALRSGKVVRRESRIVDNQFRLSPDYKHLKREVGRINPDDWIEISAKYHGCLEKDTIIQTKEYGGLTIKEIVDKRLKCNVLSFDHTQQIKTWGLVTNYLSKEGDKDWYEIELEDGSILKVTSNHPIWMPDIQCYREVKDLLIGDTVLTNK